jgi:hypothetical protein
MFLGNPCQIDLLSHATSVINQKAQNAALCREELRVVSIEEIESAERNLMEGLDYRLRCHHPYGAIKVLSADIVAHLRSSVQLASKLCGYGSPRAVYYPDDLLDALSDRAVAIAQSALVYSDVNFIFQPGKIAVAAVAIALEGSADGGRLGSSMRNYLRMRFPHKTAEELADFEFEVTRIISVIASCPAIDMNKFSVYPQKRRSMTTQIRATEVRRVFSLVARLRGLAKPQEKQRIPAPTAVAPPSRKRMRIEHECAIQPQNRCYKAARVTPIQTPMYE